MVVATLCLTFRSVRVPLPFAISSKGRDFVLPGDLPLFRSWFYRYTANKQIRDLLALSNLLSIFETVGREGMRMP